MKAIIYTSQKEAEGAVASCNESLVVDEDKELVGEQMEASEQVPDRPYTTYIKHPNQEDLYAVFADSKVEQCTKREAVELDSTWFQTPQEQTDATRP